MSVCEFERSSTSANGNYEEDKAQRRFPRTFKNIIQRKGDFREPFSHRKLRDLNAFPAQLRGNV